MFPNKLFPETEPRETLEPKAGLCAQGLLSCHHGRRAVGRSTGSILPAWVPGPRDKEEALEQGTGSTRTGAGDSDLDRDQFREESGARAAGRSRAQNVRGDITEAKVTGPCRRPLGEEGTGRGTRGRVWARRDTHILASPARVCHPAPKGTRGGPAAAASTPR